MMADRRSPQLLLWTISGMIVLVAARRNSRGNGDLARTGRAGLGAAAGIVIEFAPVPVAPATLQSELPPGPEQDIANSTPSTPVESPEERQKSDLTLEAKLEQEVEEKVEAKPIEEPPPDVDWAPESRDRDPAAAAGGEAGNAVAARRERSGDGHGASGDRRGDSGDSGRAEAGRAQPL